MPKKGLLIPVIFLISLSLYAQYIPGQNWMQLNNRQYQLIFPDFLILQAEEVAAFTEKYDLALEQGLDPQYITQYPLILYPWSMVSNGYVTSLVHHSLWYTAPMKQSLGALSWPELLTIHEGRHVKQMQSLMRSTSRALYFMGGEVLFSLSIISVPSWVYEGDAVFTETLLGDSGRGRQSSFQRNMRILWNEDNIPSSSALFLPSRKYLNTNAYSGGYFLTSWLKKEQGFEAVGELYRRQAELPLPVIGTNRAFRKITGLNLQANYLRFSEDLSQWFQEPQRWEGNVEWLSEPASSSWIIYSQLLIEEDHFFALSHSPSLHSRLIEWKEEEWQKNCDLDIFSRMDASAENLVWDQTISGDRYPDSIDTEIWAQDLLSGTKRKILGRGRYYSPAYSTDGNYLAVLELDMQSVPYLLLMDGDGENLQSIPVENAFAAFWPSWSDDGKSLLLILQNQQGSYLAQYERETNTWTALTPPSPRSLDRPFWLGGNPAFLVDDEERMNLIMLEEGKYYRLKAGAYGITSAQADREGTLYLVSRNSGKGDQIAKVETPEWEQIDEKELTEEAAGYFQQVPVDPLPAEEVILQDNEPEKYRTPLFNPYGWGLYTVLGDLPEGSYIPVTLASQDPLNSNSWEISLLYNSNEERSSMRYIGLFHYLYTPIQVKLYQDIPSQDVRPMDSIASMGISLPLGIHRGDRHLSSLSYAGFQGLLRQTGSYRQSLLLAEGQFDLQHWKSGSSRDIKNRWEQGLSAWINQPVEPQMEGIWGYSVNGAFPGPLKQRLEGRYSREYNPIGLSSKVAAPRGWDVSAMEDLEALRFTYHIPLLYPEVEISKFFFLSRIRLSAFYDRMWDNTDRIFSSAGAEITADFYPLQLPVEIYMGLRYSHRIESNTPCWEFTLLGTEIY